MEFFRAMFNICNNQPNPWPSGSHNSQKAINAEKQQEPLLRGEEGDANDQLDRIDELSTCE